MTFSNKAHFFDYTRVLTVLSYLDAVAFKFGFTVVYIIQGRVHNLISLFELHFAAAFFKFRHRQPLLHE